MDAGHEEERAKGKHKVGSVKKLNEKMVFLSLCFSQVSAKGKDRRAITVVYFGSSPFFFGHSCTAKREQNHFQMEN